jgi:hypothetical protein
MAAAEVEVEGVNRICIEVLADSIRFTSWLVYGLDSVAEYA